jgi:hypothetical protein
MQYYIKLKVGESTQGNGSFPSTVDIRSGVLALVYSYADSAALLHMPNSASGAFL